MWKTVCHSSHRNIEMRCKQHTRHFHLEQPQKSAVAEHIIDTGQSMKFNNTCRLAKVKRIRGSPGEGGYRDTVASQHLQQGWWIHA